MISKKYLEIGIDQRLYWGIDIMIISAGIGGILNSEILDKGEIFDDLNVLDWTISSHQLRYCLLVYIVQAAYEEFSNHYTFVNSLLRPGLLSKLLLLPLRHLLKYFICLFMKVKVWVSNSQPYLLLNLLQLLLLIKLFTLTKF